MNENLNLVEILKDCPKGTKLYSTVFGEVELIGIGTYNNPIYEIEFRAENGVAGSVTSDGKHFDDFDGECTLFPSRGERNWANFKPKKEKKERFDPKTLKPFDKIMARIDGYGFWCCEWFSFMEENTNMIKGCGAYYKYCIPYNEDTKHLVGTTEEAPEYYRYWEN